MKESPALESRRVRTLPGQDLMHICQEEEVNLYVDVEETISAILVEECRDPSGSEELRDLCDAGKPCSWK